MPLTKDELLKPRYKVIADYPGNIIPVRSIFWDDIESVIIVTPSGSNSIQSSYPYRDKDKYPHLFQLLPWWRDREINDYPEYVVDTNLAFHKAKWKIHPHGLFMYLDDEADNGWHVIDKIMCFYMPATPEEYIAYINLKQQCQL